MRVRPASLKCSVRKAGLPPPKVECPPTSEDKIAFPRSISRLAYWPSAKDRIEIGNRKLPMLSVVLPIDGFDFGNSLAVTVFCDFCTQPGCDYFPHLRAVDRPTPQRQNVCVVVFP